MSASKFHALRFCRWIARYESAMSRSILVKSYVT